jgi:hypothetical protein
MKKVGSNIWEELGRREELIRNAYDKAKVVLKPKQGLSLALEEANVLVAGLKSTKLPSDAAFERRCRRFM